MVAARTGAKADIAEATRSLEGALGERELAEGLADRNLAADAELTLTSGLSSSSSDGPRTPQLGPRNSQAGFFCEAERGDGHPNRGWPSNQTECS